MNHAALIDKLRKEYDPIHPPEKQYVCMLVTRVCSSPMASLRNSIGPVDPESVERVEESVSDEERARLARFDARPALSEILNLHDFEVGMLLALA
jgi:L-lactate dehydrogenase (cytochrome)